ncbi:hypothetical protein E2562_020822 [Oryza meyeriana var. granulata]|uniref:Uncharacterized protein n=1 Tax=Oryza meyeriana var. granulata TaxID=110450 RepID=A0A6G1CJ37_9ORYZ|nr:hypothetical protein E2562_020822 [Oryza meyeriana var. granulata]
MILPAQGYRETSQTEEGKEGQIKRKQLEMSKKRPCRVSQQEDEPEMRRRRCSSMSKSQSPRPLGLVPCCSSHLSKRQYLYLVLDDWERGYVIHRVSEDDFHYDVGGLNARPAKRPLHRIQAQHAFSSPGIPVFNTGTLEMTRRQPTGDGDTSDHKFGARQ